MTRPETGETRRPMKCHVINLDSRPDRLAHMERELGRHGLTVERFPAIDWHDLEAAGIHHPIFPLGHIACSFSHLALLKAIGEGDDPWAVVLEDDVFLTDDAGRFLGRTDWIPAGADLVKLETFATVGYFRRAAVSVTEGHTTHELLHKHTGAAAYVVSRDYAARFAAAVDVPTATRKIDELLFDPRWYPFRDAVVLQLRPAIAVQEMVWRPKSERRYGSDIGTFTKEFGWHPDPVSFDKYRGPLGRIRMWTKGPRDRLKAILRFLRLAVRHHTLAMFMEMVPFAPRHERP